MSDTQLKDAVPSGTAQDALGALTPLPMETGVIVLRADQLPRAQEQFGRFDFLTMRQTDIVLIGSDAEKKLNGILDGFLGKLDGKTAADLFKLFNELKKGVDDADLPTLLDKVQAADKVGFWARLAARFGGKSIEDTIHDAYEAVRGTLSGKTKTLADEMHKLEGSLNAECQKLIGELRVLDALKLAYGEQRAEFAIAAAVANGLLAKARVQVAEFAADVLANPDAQKQARLQELQAKLEMLESRALALEGTYTRLPADQLVIQQIENAGVSTLQEVATTAFSRFASIKMTLLALQGSLAVKTVQNLADSQAQLDAQLAAVRGSVTKQIATSAANAPGDNRLKQAEQIKKIIADTKEIEQIVSAAREANQQKFATARTMLAESRDELAKMSKP